MWCILQKKYPPNNRWETKSEKTDYVFLVQTYYKIRRKKSKQFSPYLLKAKEKKYGIYRRTINCFYKAAFGY